MSDAMHLLLVDDNEVNLDLLGRRLERKGCTIVAVTDGVAALRALETATFDAVVLDLRMPGMTGLEVLQVIRTTRSQLELPVIMATAQTDPEDMVATLDAGANDYVTKPIDVNVLHARLRAHTRTRTARPTAPARLPPVTLQSEAPPPATPLAAPSAPAAIGVGVVIDGRFRLEELLGSGGFGSVYRARHLRLDSDVAVKMVHPHLVGASAVLRRFELEAISTCRVRHPHAVQVLDAGTAQGGIPYLVMELLTGPTLADELEGLGRLSLRRTAEILVPICQVLEEAHRVGIVHRDVKPANVVLADSPRGEVVKVLDFGIATFLERDRRSGLTGEGAIGTPVYMSPEALLGRAVTVATDVYSVGVTAYVMLGGEPPHGPPAENPYEQAIRQVHELPTSLAKLRPDLPLEVVQVVMATLAREPAHRPSLEELRDVITRWAEQFEEPVWPLSRQAASAMSGPPSAEDTTIHVVGAAPGGARDKSGVESRAADAGATEQLPADVARGNV